MRQKRGVIQKKPRKVLTLLPKHDDPSCQSRSSVARHSEQLNELRKQVLASVGLSFQLNSHIGIVGVSSSLKIAMSQTLERAERLFGVFVLNVPSVIVLQNESQWPYTISTHLGLSGQKYT